MELKGLTKIKYEDLNKNGNLPEIPVSVYELWNKSVSIYRDENDGMIHVYLDGNIALIKPDLTPEDVEHINNCIEPITLEIDAKSMAQNLYTSGWRNEDYKDIAKEFDLTAEEANDVCEALAVLEYADEVDLRECWDTGWKWQFEAADGSTFLIDNNGNVYKEDPVFGRRMIPNASVDPNQSREEVAEDLRDLEVNGKLNTHELKILNPLCR